MNMPLPKKPSPLTGPAAQELSSLQNKGGYTLLEMLAVLSLLAILAGLALPRFTSMPYWQLDAASRQMAAELRLLRQAAINCGGKQRAEFYIYLNRYTLDTPGGRRHLYLPKEVQFEGTTTFNGLPPAVQFNCLGRPSSGGTVVLKSGAGRRYIIVTPVTGRVRVSRDPPQNW